MKKTIRKIIKKIQKTFSNKKKISHIYFLIRAGRNYSQVQKQTFNIIQNKMPKGSYTTIKEVDFIKKKKKTIKNGLSFDMFIRASGDVLMSHGVADKNYLTMRDENGECYINRRKHVLVPGPWLKNKLLNHPKITLNENQIHCVGWPRLDELIDLQNKYKSNQKPTEKVKVLWAPTHDRRKRGKEGLSTSSYPEFDQWTELLEDKFDYTKSLHPRNKVLDKKPTVDALIEADYVISDFGTIVYEAWALGKPVIFPNWLIGQRIKKNLKGSAEAYIFENKIGLHANSIQEVVDFIELKKEIGDDVKQFMESYLPEDLNGQSANTINELFLKGCVE
ncbi:glycosyltransferase family protein [Thiomicrospira cyclica]|uniref:CDP-glycerol:poly(Glycerophosphate) glycerophosphotransferase n=1 Tax=Thiomicrospira cyclica (strain DSM 14477 / JCM 11371 / ALM1) TaxID=717773 RepID=F6DCW1_THICA|nr:hypothetical protein [Thiomicrospira cyclica]AEG31697.1 hypothetical protein Thicy_0930 [Thiomicrospira cyclica ALM1]